MISAEPIRKRGQPLLLLVFLLGSWIAVRAAVWEAPFDFAAPVFAGMAKAGPQAPTLSAAPVAGMARLAPPGNGMRDPVWPIATAPGSAGIEDTLGSEASDGLTAGRVPPGGRSGRPLSAQLAQGHQLLLLAGLGYATLAEAEAAGSHPAMARAPGAFLGGSAPRSGSRGGGGGSRWSGDGWLLVRGGNAGAGSAGGGAGYGGSQAGAVLRYDLAPGSVWRPAAYVRASGSFGPNGSGDRELAAGVAFRPVPAIPLAAMAEGRLQHSGGQDRLRPAAAVVTELPPLRLPWQGEAEIYAQAGYVGGKDATPFFDAQAVADRPVAALGKSAQFRLGGGAWAGGQRGATRLDVGPRASVRVDLGGTALRIAADWRFRVAGQASPGSGPALTLSTGF
jgi:hypothetical protein